VRGNAPGVTLCLQALLVVPYVLEEFHPSHCMRMSSLSRLLHVNTKVRD
jgi:hypothetical protein